MTTRARRPRRIVIRRINHAFHETSPTTDPYRRVRSASSPSLALAIPASHASASARIVSSNSARVRFAGGGAKGFSVVFGETSDATFVVGARPASMTPSFASGLAPSAVSPDEGGASNLCQPSGRSSSALAAVFVPRLVGVAGAVTIGAEAEPSEAVDAAAAAMVVAAASLGADATGTGTASGCSAKVTRARASCTSPRR